MQKIGFCLLLFLACSVRLEAQKFSVTQGKVDFTSRAELELIRASSTELIGIIDTTSNKVAFKVSNKSFQGFNSGLQRQHFNDKYMESHLYPSSTFTGKIIEKVDYSTNGTYQVRVKGELEIHGQKQMRIIKGKLIVRDKGLSIETTVPVPLADHNISIPKIVSQKIATEIEVNIAATLVPNAGE